jgi:hypothetical protein
MGFKDLLTNPGLFKNLVLVTINWTVCAFCFYLVGFFVGEFAGSIYTIGLSVMAADLFSNVCVRVIQHFLPTRKAFILAFGFGFTFSIVYQFV